MDRNNINQLLLDHTRCSQSCRLFYFDFKVWALQCYQRPCLVPIHGGFNPVLRADFDRVLQCGFVGRACSPNATRGYHMTLLPVYVYDSLGPEACYHILFESIWYHMSYIYIFRVYNPSLKGSLILVIFPLPGFRMRLTCTYSWGRWLARLGHWCYRVAVSL